MTARYPSGKAKPEKKSGLTSVRCSIAWYHILVASAKSRGITLRAELSRRLLLSQRAEK